MPLKHLTPTINTLKYAREDHHGIDKEVQAAVAFGRQHGIDVEAEFNRHHRPRAIPRRIDERPQNGVDINLTEHYRKEFLRVLDVQMSALEENLTAAFEIVEPAAQLLVPPYSSEIEDKRLISSIVSLFLDDCKPDEDSLLVELNIFCQHFKENRPEACLAQTASEYCKEFKSLFPLTERCFRLTLTAPITNSSNERSFSKLRSIKTLMRSTARQERLEHVTKLACEKELTDNIDL